MNAGKKFVAIRIAWPVASAATLQRWRARHVVFTTAVSVKHAATQERMLFLLETKNPFLAFEAACFVRALAPSTAETYWGSYMSLRHAISGGPKVTTAEDAKILQLLKARAAQWQPAFPICATKLDIDKIIVEFGTLSPTITAVTVLSWTYGQRISDMIQIAANDFSTTASDNIICLTIRRGKTMSVSKPYPLFLRRGTWLTEGLIEAAQTATKEGRSFLCSVNNTPEEREKASFEVKAFLIHVNDTLELRSLRRGGLTHLASFPDTSTEDLLLLSRHRDKDMLMRYLGWGQASATSARTMLEIIERAH